MDVRYRCGCGVDVHARTVVACLSKNGQKHPRTFGTMTADVVERADWLLREGCTHGASESTGGYWRPVFNLLEGQGEGILVNARHLKAVPGRKTDVRDSEGLADWLRHGLLKASFIPPHEIREGREVTRYRQTRVKSQAAVTNRSQRILECGNIKLGQGASAVVGGVGPVEVTGAGSGGEEWTETGRLRARAIKAPDGGVRAGVDGALEECAALRAAGVMRAGR